MNTYTPYKLGTITAIMIFLAGCGGGSGGGGGTNNVAPAPGAETVTLCTTESECKSVLLAGRAGRYDLKNANGEQKHAEEHLKDRANRLTTTRWGNSADYTDPASSIIDPRGITYQNLFDFTGTEQTKSSTWRLQERVVGLDKISQRGNGVKLGILDPGIFVTRNKDYASRLQTGMALYQDRYDNANSRWTYKWYDSYRPLWNTKYGNKFTGYSVGEYTDEHADPIASLMAGTEYGIAKKALIVPYTVMNLGRINHQGLQLKPVYDHMKANDVMAMNISLGLDRTNTLDNLRFALGNDFINQVRDDKRNNRDGPIWVFAAGNEGNDNVDLMARAPTLVPELEDYWLSVVSITQQLRTGQPPGTVIWEYHRAFSSNNCGDAKRWCLAAYGHGARYERSNIEGTAYTNYGTVGTSFASPQVTGGLAVLKQRFPTLTNVDIRNRLLTTASHTTADGKPLRDVNGNEVTPDSNGLSDVFGRGIMRLDLAVRPYRGLSLSSIYSAKATKSSLETKSSLVYSGQAFGDGFKNGFSKINTKAFDALMAPFDYNMSKTVGTYTPPHTDMQYLSPIPLNQQAQKAPTQTFTFTDAKHTKMPMGFTYAQSSVPFGADKGMVATYNTTPTTALSLTIAPAVYDKNNLNTLSLQYAKTLRNTSGQDQKLFYGVHSEKGSIFGTRMQGQFALNGHTNTAYVLYKNSQFNNGWLWDFTSVFGVSKISGLSGMMSRLNNISVSEWSLSANRDMGKHTVFGISIRQPIRIESGIADVVHISKIDKGNAVSYTTSPTNITPSGREIRFETYYQYKRLSLKAYYKHDTNHTKGKSNTGIFAYYKIPFK